MPQNSQASMDTWPYEIEYHTPSLIHALLQSNNDGVAYIESFSSLSVGHTTPYHSNRLSSLCIWQFSMCHVEIKLRMFRSVQEHQRAWKSLKTTPRADRLLKRLARQKQFSTANTLRSRWIVNGRISRQVVLVLYVQIPIWNPRQTWVL
jgi:hypothetical protein